MLQLESSVALAVVGPTQPRDNDRLRWDQPPDSEDMFIPPRVLEVPVIVAVGKPFQLTVYTIGRNGCWRSDGLEVRRKERVVEVVPYDRHSGAGICTQVLSYLPHRTMLTLDEPGDWVIRVEGRRVRHGEAEWETPVFAETTIVAQ